MAWGVGTWNAMHRDSGRMPCLEESLSVGRWVGCMSWPRTPRYAALDVSFQRTYTRMHTRYVHTPLNPSTYMTLSRSTSPARSRYLLRPSSHHRIPPQPMRTRDSCAATWLTVGAPYLTLHPRSGQAPPCIEATKVSRTLGKADIERGGSRLRASKAMGNNRPHMTLRLVLVPS
jgi:hypothetical protein